MRRADEIAEGIALGLWVSVPLLLIYELFLKGGI